ncbi:MAG: hypothetical protein Kow0026_13410 [Oricola sp.]
MRMLLVIAALVIVIVWDFAQNGGDLTNAIIRHIIQFARSAGF